MASAPGKPTEVATEGRRGGLYCLLEKWSMAVTPGTPEGASVSQDFPPRPLELRAAALGAQEGVGGGASKPRGHDGDVE